MMVLIAYTMCETNYINVVQAERRRKLGLPAEDPTAPKPPAPVVEEKKVVLSYLIPSRKMLNFMMSDVITFQFQPRSLLVTKGAMG